MRIPRIPWSIPVVIILLVIAGLEREALRHAVAELLGVPFKNSVLSIYSIATAPDLDTADLVPIAHEDIPPYAVNVFLDQEVEVANVERSLDLIKAAGFHAIKQELIWSDIERPVKGRFEDNAVPGKSSWQKYDRIVDLARQRGIEVIFRIDTSPDWARTGTDKIQTPPDRVEDYGDFVAAVVQRYRGRVRYYQIWNEPNLAFEWGDRRPDPAAYVALLKEANHRAKAIDPAVVIISASLAPTIENSERAANDVGYLQAMYNLGAQPYFDILAVNAYGLRNGPDDWRFNRTDDVNFSRPVVMRNVMVHNGDSQKPIWASEIGWNSLPPNWPEAPLFGSVSREIQAAYTTRAYARAAEQWPWMGVMAVWHFRMIHPESVSLQQYYFDLVANDWTIEPVYRALQAYLTAPPVVHRGYHQEDFWAFRWGSGWEAHTDDRAVLSGYRQSNTPGAVLSFDLDASWFDLVVPTGPAWGRLGITIDGSPLKANRLPSVHGQAIVDLSAPRETWQRRIAIAEGLTPGVHRVEIRVLQGPVGIDGIVADRESPKAILYWQATGAVIGIGFLVAAWRSRPAAGSPREATPRQSAQQSFRAPPRSSEGSPTQKVEA